MFIIEVKVFLKLSPMNGVLWFKKSGKHNSRLIIPFEILWCITKWSMNWPNSRYFSFAPCISYVNVEYIIVMVIICSNKTHFS